MSTLADVTTSDCFLVLHISCNYYFFCILDLVEDELKLYGFWYWFHFTGCEGEGDETLGQLCGNSVGLSIQMDSNTSNGAACLNEVSVPPPLCHLDMGVLKSLPPELFSELNEIYGGKLVDFVAKNKGKTENINHTLSAYSLEKIEGEGFFFSFSLIYIFIL